MTKQNIPSRTYELYSYAKEIIPGGTQLLSKRPEMFAPDVWPAYFSKAKGCEVWDLDGNHYYDMSLNGIAACLLGYADPDVSEAVIRRVQDGSMCTLNPPEEVELADRLCEIHPWAQQVRYARTGGEIASVAVRIARATTKRTKIAVCGYHGWHDWYLAANLGRDDSLDGHLLAGLNPAGVPRLLCDTVLPFRYNQIEQLADIVKTHGADLAAIIMEPTRHKDPENGFLADAKELASQCGSLLIFDEISIGWRLCFGGAHLYYGVNPDMAVFAKALGNGHPIAAVLGTKEAMDGAHTSFISSTYWTESVGPVAALAVLEKMSRNDVPRHIDNIGRKVNHYWKESARRHGLAIEVCDSRPCLTHVSFIHEKAQELKTLYTQLMLGKGFLASTSIYTTLAHDEHNILMYGKAIDDVFAEIAPIVAENRIDEGLRGPVAHTGFSRLS